MSDRFSNHTSAERPCPSRKRVLLVDEQCGELSCLTETLYEHGCEVHSCKCYADGLRQIESKFFDFIVVCQGGPQFEGKLVLERAIEIDRRTPILVVTPLPRYEMLLGGDATGSSGLCGKAAGSRGGRPTGGNPLATARGGSGSLISPNNL